MKRRIRIWAFLLALLLLTACGKTQPLAEPTVQKPPAAEEPVQEEVREETEEAPGLSAFAGIYRAQVPEEGDAAYVQITDCHDFLLLEHFLCMEGSVYSFWAEEFWPGADGVRDGEFVSVSGLSQTFSVMTATDGYDTLPRNRCITLTEDGVVLNYDDSDAAYYVTDTEFTYHTELRQLRERLGEDTGKRDDALFGTWVYRNGREAVCIRMEEDGSIYLLQKKVGQPAQVYCGAFCFEKGDSISVMAEKLGDGQYPHVMTLSCKVDADGMLWLTLDNGEEFVLLPTREAVVKTVDGEYALSYFGSQYDLCGEYTDQYGSDYLYTYRLPYFLGDGLEAAQINAQIAEQYAPLIEDELLAMEQEEFLSYTDVDWESNVYEGVLYLHIWAKTWDWEEHSAYYYDVHTGTFLAPEEVLDRLLIDRAYFLEAVREGAQEAFRETFADVPEEYKREYGYEELLEWTGSEEAVNLSLPIYVNRFGSIAVYTKIGSMAGSGVIWTILYPFDGAVG